MGWGASGTGNGVKYQKSLKSASEGLKSVPIVWIWCPMVTLVPKMPKLEIFIIDPGTGPGGTPAQLRDFTASDQL